MTLPSPPATLEQLIQTASRDKDYKPVWRQLVRTRLFAACDAGDAGDANSPGALQIRPGKKDGKPALLVAQQRDQLPLEGGSHARQMFGGEIIKALPAGVAIGLVLGNGVFTIPANLVDWLRGNLQKSAPAVPATAVRPTEAAASQASSNSAFPAINPDFPVISMPQDEPKPGLTSPALASAPPEERHDIAGLPEIGLAGQSNSVPTKSTPATPQPPSQSPPVKSNSTLTLALEESEPIDMALQAPKSTQANGKQSLAALDIQSLNPRHVEYPALGLEFFVPGHWRETVSGSTIQFIDPQNQTKITVSSLQRDNVALERWLEMRLPTVTKEMPFLQQVAPSYPVHGSEWRDRISAQATEFKGTFHLDTEETNYLICCLRSDTTLVAVTIRASSTVFEANRALYQWLFGQMNITDMALPPVATPGQRSIDADDGPVPALLGMSTSGRIGRMRYFAYSALMWVPIALIMAAALTLMKDHAILAASIIAITMIWPPLRLIVLRMHDFNLSGKWLLLLFLLPGLAGALQKPGLTALFSALFWLAMIPISFWPGSSDDNAYGPRPGPDPAWVKLVAGICIVLQLLGMVALAKIIIKGGNPWAGRAALGQQTAEPGEMRNFSPLDKSFRVMVPGTMRETPMRDLLPPGIKSQHIYTLNTSEHNYFIQDMEFAIAPPDRTEVQDRVRDNFVANVRGEIIAESPVRVDGFSGRDVRVKLPNGSIEDLRILISGPRLFLIMIESPKGKDQQERIDAFLGSFHIG